MQRPPEALSSSRRVSDRLPCQSFEKFIASLLRGWLNWSVVTGRSATFGVDCGAWFFTTITGGAAGFGWGLSAIDIFPSQHAA